MRGLREWLARFLVGSTGPRSVDRTPRSQLFHCTACERTYVGGQVEQCSGCGRAVVSVPTAAELGYGARTVGDRPDPRTTVVCTDCPFEEVVVRGEDRLPADVVLKHGQETGHRLTITRSESNQSTGGEHADI